jgi:hypothetical protein
MTGILQFAALLLPWLSQVATSPDVQNFVNWGIDAIKKMVEGDTRDPTEAEWTEMNARIDALRLKLHSDID